MSNYHPSSSGLSVMQIRALAEGPLEEIQKKWSDQQVSQEFYDLAIENDLYRCTAREYGGYGLSELEILQVQEEFSGPGRNEDAFQYARI